MSTHESNTRGSSTQEGSVPDAGTFVNERQVRAAAGITMVLGALAFGYAAFAKEYLPIRVITAFFTLDFALRVWVSVNRSPVGLLARWMTAAMPAEWVSVAPKRFAWTLGASMALAMTVITNARITGTLPKTICVICLTLMWLEAVLGVCLGCRVYRLLRTRGWIAARADVQSCSDGSCDLVDSPR